MSYLIASAVVIHYEEALCQVYAPLPLCTFTSMLQHNAEWFDNNNNNNRIYTALYGRNLRGVITYRYLRDRANRVGLRSPDRPESAPEPTLHAVLDYQATFYLFLYRRCVHG